MAPIDIARRRLFTQRVAGRRLEDAAEVVAWLGAVQAQDFLGALWGIALRTRTATEADVERAIADRSIVRTWPMRGTLHLVPARDVRWMLRLLAPRATSAAAARHRELGLGDADFARSRRAVAKALRGGRRLGRDALYGVLREAGVDPAGQRGIHVLQQLSHEAFVCFASREGKQHTFALLEEWVPAGPSPDREEALALLATRYFTGHGPATVEDLAWWSGLTAADAREALELARPRLVRDTVAGRAYWRSGAGSAPARAAAAGRLLPPFDELLVGYRDRRATLDPAYADRVGPLLRPTFVLGGRVAGTWTRALARDAVRVRASFFERPGAAALRAFEAAAAEYARFLGRRLLVA